MKKQSELFSIQEVKKDSPKLAWMKKYDLTTYHAPHLEREEEPWCCVVGSVGQFLAEWGNTYDALATGKTEDDAVLEWAKRNKVPLWNEEAYAQKKENL